MNRWTSVVVSLLIVAIVGTALAVGLSGNQSAVTGCKGSGKPVAHKAVIQGDQVVTDDHLAAKLCDTLTITNKDNTTREIAFGLHEHHEPYDGVTERVLGKDDSLTVTLNKAGSFRWHDHIHDEIQGYFTVK